MDEFMKAEDIKVYRELKIDGGRRKKGNRRVRHLTLADSPSLEKKTQVCLNMLGGPTDNFNRSSTKAHFISTVVTWRNRAFR